MVYNLIRNQAFLSGSGREGFTGKEVFMNKKMLDTIGFVKEFDPAVGDAMELELKRQRRNIELIASENLVSPTVLAASMSILWKISRLSGQKSFSARNTPMFSRTAERRPIWPSISRCSNPETR